ncbi:L-aspartate oxidase [Tomitella fengzijianii]|uniref:L-aspartate oxidase n=1 Tax=Tomitella fengzijianii TaxID=2597660 RepID=A0A516X448_9ACTN|nr:L-aspartate oxidase [Tomitella fengzijianii]QDQ97837.1 L-aspartate oxidase [Tomitella fengzijianii]
MAGAGRGVGPAVAAVRWEAHADLVVVGGGVAGLSAARAAARRGLAVLVLQKGTSLVDGPVDGGAAAVDTSTAFAQGGVAVARTRNDSPAAHADDTCDAGAGLCDRSAVESIVADGPRALARLVESGAEFDRCSDGDYAVTREGGHRVRRILHAHGDATGAEVQRALDAACGVGDSGIARVTGATVLRVCTDHRGVTGVLAETADGHGVVHAHSVLLATGGLGRLYSVSTNPAAATGDGIALALDAGAQAADLEFIQFHPTALHVPGAQGRSPLVSEAVRGEGGVLVDSRGRSVTDGAHPMGDLAPRDVVARAIAARMRETGDTHVYLDARAVEGFSARFPTITASCLPIGIDPAVEPIPVAPAAHFSCGGVVTDVHGRTGVPGLFAAGEVARTGLHGANRLASNSLLEGLVVGERAGLAAVERATMSPEVLDAAFRLAPAAPRERVQEMMTAHGSVTRAADGLAAGAAGIRSAAEPVLVRTRSDAEDAALTIAASAVLASAARRTETRGCHTREDHPTARPEWLRSIVFEQGEGGMPRLVKSGPLTEGPARDSHLETAGADR